jgi:uncharacterized protein (DUF362 family)
MNKFGKVIVEEAVDKEIFIELVRSLQLKPPIVIKPNWGFSVCFTEAVILDWTLEACGGDALVVESYGWARTEEMLTTGKWGSFEKDDLRKSDSWFLQHSGINEVLEKHDVEFLNITEENWAGRTISAKVMSELLEEREQSIVVDDFLGFVPERLFELRGGTFLSLAKVRTLEAPMWISLSVKNLFGLIPGPSRGKYHGKEHSRLAQSIVDIYKVYDILFEIKGVVEAAQTASRRDRETFEWSNIEQLHFASASTSPIELDAVISGLLRVDPKSVEYMKLASEALGPWKEESVKEAMGRSSKLNEIM